MFNLDEVDVDFNDEVFDVLQLKFNNPEKHSNQKGILSYGLCSTDEMPGIVLPSKRKYQESHISSQCSILDKRNNAENIKECKQLFSNHPKANISDQLHDSNRTEFIPSPSYSPITSTQKETVLNNLGCLFDRSNSISPIKIKPGICSELRKPSTVFSHPKNSCNDFENSKVHKFPGPAGDLPKMTNENSFPTLKKSNEIKYNENSNSSKFQSKTDSYNNLANQIEQSGSWKRAMDVIGQNVWSDFQNYNLENVLKMVEAPGGLLNCKIPVICLALTEIEYLPMDAAAKLADQTGSVKCAIHRYVLEKYKEKIKTGSVFILKKVSIFSPSGKKYYLNITQPNIIDIISPSDNGDIIYDDPIITKTEIRKIIDECSEIPKIVFDPNSLDKELKDNHSNELRTNNNIQQTNPNPEHNNLRYNQLSTSNNQHVNRDPSSHAQPMKPTNEKAHEFFDDDMDNFLMSFMDESFAE